MLEPGNRGVDENCCYDIEQTKNTANHPDTEQQVEGRPIALAENYGKRHAVLGLVVAQHETEGREHGQPHSAEKLLAIHVMQVFVAILGSIAILQVLIGETTLADQVLAVLRPPHYSEGQTQNEQNDQKERDDADQSREPQHEAGEHVGEILEESGAEKLGQAEDSGDAQGAQQRQQAGRGVRYGAQHQLVEIDADVHDGKCGDGEIQNVPAPFLPAEIPPGAKGRHLRDDLSRKDRCEKDFQEKPHPTARVEVEANPEARDAHEDRERDQRPDDGHRRRHTEQPTIAHIVVVLQTVRNVRRCVDDLLDCDGQQSRAKPIDVFAHVWPHAPQQIGI
mmetsp:Transcript_18999/g.54481  ORF Transcript_18999/g.54481 Transcript_18999/m.54481 type:complete len:336 (+) Transcript_18999:881-1888(+)